ncbi:MAG: hypothetical protein KF729_08815 [Sandaracinaceae bacterium]|nr:hypothetical protein [Sandaracinaceae bacterium]
MSNRALAALAALVLVACDGDPVPFDGGRVRDGSVGDGGGLLDAAAWDGAGPAADASAGDAGVSSCDALACDPRRPREGCAAGVCALWSDAPSCEDGSSGRLTGGASCEDVGDCVPGLACFQDAAGGGVCGRVCCPGDPAGCAVGSRCGGAGVLVDGTRTGWGTCLNVRSCDLLRPTTCEDREGCYLIEATMTTECRIAGAAAAGEACDLQEDCAAGLFCGGIAAARRCVRFCDLRNDRCPPAEGRCVAQSHTIAFEHVGLCTLDMTTVTP